VQISFLFLRKKGTMHPRPSGKSAIDRREDSNAQRALACRRDAGKGASSSLVYSKKEKKKEVRAAPCRRAEGRKEPCKQLALNRIREIREKGRLALPSGREKNSEEGRMFLKPTSYLYEKEKFLHYLQEEKSLLHTILWTERGKKKGEGRISNNPGCFLLYASSLKKEGYCSLGGKKRPRDEGKETRKPPKKTPQKKKKKISQQKKKKEGAFFKKNNIPATSSTRESHYLLR